MATHSVRALDVFVAGRLWATGSEAGTEAAQANALAQKCKYGAAKTPDVGEIRWQSGIVLGLRNIPSDRIIKVKEPSQ